MRWGRSATPPHEDWVWPTPPPSADDAREIEASAQFASPAAGSFDGEIFWKGISGGYIDEIADLDYWTLRQRSSAVFYSNMYARGIVRRLVTNVIHIGLRPEWLLTRNHEIIGITKEHAKTLQRTYEKRFTLFCNSPEIIDVKGTRSDGDLQAQIYQEAIVSGDCLVINRQDPDTGLPQLQIVTGDRVQTPIEYAMDPNVVDGIRLDKRGRHVGYYVYQWTAYAWDDKYTYIRARGAKSGRKTAWLVYGCDKREDGVRGEPLLGIVLQGLNDLNSFKGSALLKAGITSKIIAQIERDKSSGLPDRRVSNAASSQEYASLDPLNPDRLTQFNQIEPGLILQDGKAGEKLSAFAVSGSDVNFGPFEATITGGIAWALQIPPEILMLSFNKAFNASQAALNEFNMFLGRERPRFASEHCQNVAEEWQISEALMGKIEAPGFLESLRIREQYDVRRAWMTTDWLGSVKVTTDPQRQGKGFELQIKHCWTTNGRVSRALNGTKFEDNVETVTEENTLLADAMRPLLELQKEYGADKVKEVAAMSGISIAAIQDDEEEAVA